MKTTNDKQNNETRFQRNTTMRIERIDLSGDTGHLKIERLRGSDTIRIDSILRDPAGGGRGEEAWKVWELPATASDEELFDVASQAQRRTDGRVGTESERLGFFGELLRFKD
ncbi:MAG: hypothetical protein FWD61_00275 [Phycisphaerales bacterium]|nr:hypothetical protein [Phycisphaerales bacterium]